MRISSFLLFAILELASLSFVLAKAQDNAEKLKVEGAFDRPKAFPVEMDDDRQFTYLGFSPDSAILFYSVSHRLGAESPMLVFYDMRERKKIKTLSGPNPAKHSITAGFLPGSKQLIIKSYGDSQPQLLDWRAGKYTPLECDASESSASGRFALTAKGDYLVSIGSRSRESSATLEFHVWKVATGKKVKRFGGEPNQQIGQFCLSDDGKFLVAEGAKVIKPPEGLEQTLTADFFARVWDMDSGNEIGLVGRTRELVLRRNDPRPNILKELIGSATRCRVRVSPSGKVMIVPVIPRETALQAEVVKGGFVSLRELATGTELDRFDEFAEASGPRQFGFSPDQKILVASGQLAVGKRKWGLLAWNVSAYKEKAIRFNPVLSDEQMRLLWAKFAEKDAVLAYRALRQLAAAPKQSLPFAKSRLKASPDRSQEVARLLSQVSSLKEGAKARERLLEIGDEAIGEIEKAFNDSSSEEKKNIMRGILTKIRDQNEPDAKTRQAMWTIELLEFVGSADSITILTDLSQGAPASWLTQEARASIKRLSSRN